MEACDILNIIQKKNRDNPQWINRRMYRLLYNPTLYILAYERLKSKPGNMTPGTDGETLDGYSMETIYRLITLMRTERYQPRPVRRQYIPKKNRQQRRPLGIPSPRDKIVQECLRLILEAIYEPHFHPHSHAYRPGRSCHTALESLRRNWVGTKWVIETDITACFERINHQRLLEILREKIQDDRFINLIRKFLKAGYLEDWQYHQTYSGTPQGAVLSPILTNIYLDKLDQYLDTLCQQYSQGQNRRTRGKYAYLLQQRKRLLVQGETYPETRGRLQGQLRELNKRILHTPRAYYDEATYTRVKFIRYADDVIISVIGPKALAQQVRRETAEFLSTNLQLELNEAKTHIIHLATERAHFLGYTFQTASPRYRRRNLRRKGSPHNVVQTIKTTSGNITLLMPVREISQKLKKYMAHGQPASIPAYINHPVEHIIGYYDSVLRGWYNYYQLAENVGRLNYARYILRYSLAKTLAHKENSSVYRIFRKYGKDITFVKPNGRRVQLFNRPLRQVKRAPSFPHKGDSRPTWIPRKTQSRLLDNCAICGSAQDVQMHHVRHIRKRGEKVHGFTLYMAAINRKQVPVCRKCHWDIHTGKYDGMRLSEILKQITVSESVEEGSSQ